MIRQPYSSIYANKGATYFEKEFIKRYASM